MGWIDGERGRARLWLSVLLLAVLGLSGPAWSQPAQARFVVVLDAAHGGDDTGGHLNDGSLRKPPRWR